MKRLRHFLSYVLIAVFLAVMGVAVHDVFFADEGSWLTDLLYRPASQGRHKGGPCDGIDVSHHQGYIDWNAVARDTMVQFVYLKATEGSTHVDRYYARNMAGARRAGLPVGSYHFLTSKSNIVSQFLNFYEHARPEEQDLLPVIDVEWSGTGDWSVSQLQDSLSLFAHLTEEYYHCKPIIYADMKFYEQYLKGRFNDYPLFIAHYKKSQPQLNEAGRYYLWQRDDHGRVPGIGKDVDFDVFTTGSSLSDILLK